MENKIKEFSVKLKFVLSIPVFFQWVPHARWQKTTILIALLWGFLSIFKQMKNSWGEK